MKTLILMSLMCVSLIAQAGPNKEIVLANEGDFIVLNDVDSNSMGIFLSYAGKQFNHCGVKLRTHSFGPLVEELDGALVIESAAPQEEFVVERGLIENGRIVAKVEDPEQTLFGDNFVIRARDKNKTVRQALLNLSNHSIADVIVEILTCE